MKDEWIELMQLMVFISLEFTLKVWLGHLGNGRVSTNERQVLLRKSVSLVDLAYLGTLVSQALK